MHSKGKCGPWQLLGIACPFQLLEAVEKSRKRDRQPADAPEEAFDFHVLVGDKLKKKQENTNLVAAQLAILLEAYRRGLTDAVGRKGTKVTIPVEMIREAWDQGARGAELALWVAAAAAVGAVIAARGSLSGLTGALQGTRGSLANPGGFGGRFFQAMPLFGGKLRFPNTVGGFGGFFAAAGGFGVGSDFSGTEG